MNPTRKVVRLVALAGLVVTVMTSAASRSEPLTDTIKACVNAYGSAQEFHRKDDLLKARQAMLICAGRACPAIIQNDCTTWLNQLAEAIPSVVLEAKLDDDNVFDVSVSMDGAPIASQLDGKPIEINPGLHSFVFERRGNTPIERKIIVAARTKSQVIVAVWKSAVPAPLAAPAAAQTGGESPLQTVRPVPALVYVLGGVAVAALGTSAVLGLTSEATENNLKSHCAPTCQASEVNSLRSRFIGADVALGAGAVAAVGGIAVFLARPERPAHAPGLTAVMLAPASGGGALEWTGSF